MERGCSSGAFGVDRGAILDPGAAFQRVCSVFHIRLCSCNARLHTPRLPVAREDVELDIDALQYTHTHTHVDVMVLPGFHEENVRIVV